MDGELGLRERKKQRTRQLIADTARAMFVERGFDAVAVAEVARSAEVAEATVFNYFPTKEDLVFQGMEAFEAELLDAVRERPVGEPVLTAFGRFLLAPRGLLAARDQDSANDLAGVARMIATSPALQARQREIFARYTASLAALLAEETGTAPDHLRPWVVAHALIGVHQALIGFVHRRLVDGPTEHARLAREVRSQGQRALKVLEEGLAGYDLKTGTEAVTKRATAPRPSVRSSPTRRALVGSPAGRP
jgi:AcrR family transcriptional regulator